jgi:hypothetical protein
VRISVPGDWNAIISFSFKQSSSTPGGQRGLCADSEAAKKKDNEECGAEKAKKTARASERRRKKNVREKELDRGDQRLLKHFKRT